MKLQLSPNRWSCLVSSFAMALGTTVDALITIVGHDGSEIVWPDLPEPNRRRGHHPQEMVYAAHNLGFTVTLFEAAPVSVGVAGAAPFLVPMTQSRMPNIMKEAAGVLTGRTLRGQAHAVAWDGSVVLDPAGRICPVEDFGIEAFWRVVRIKSA